MSTVVGNPSGNSLQSGSASPTLTGLHVGQLALPYNADARVAWAFGNSLAVAGAVYGDLTNDPRLFTSMDLWGWVNAGLGRPWRQVQRYGINGASSTQILAHLKDKLARAVSAPNDILLFGLCHNDVNSGLSASTTVENIKKMLEACSGLSVILAVDTMWDAGQTSAGRITYNATVEAVMRLAASVPKVTVLPVHTNFNSKTPGTTTASRSVTIDGIHPSAVGVAQCLAPQAVSGLSSTRRGLGVPLVDGDDFNSVTYNPFVGESNASGSGEFYAQGGATGSGPRGFLCKIESGTLTVTSEKVAHPKNPGWGHGEAAAACWKVSMENTGVTNGEVTIATLDASAVAWGSGLSLSTSRQFVKPSVSNGCLYKVVAAGSLATGTDPTAGWSTALGTEFTAGTATLRCVTDWRGKNIQAFFEVFPDQTTMAGKFALQFFAFATTNAAPYTALPGYGGWCYGLTQALGTVSEFGTDGGLSWLPDYLLPSTAFSPDMLVPNSAENYSAVLKVRLAPSSTLDLVFSAFGAAVVA